MFSSVYLPLGTRCVIFIIVYNYTLFKSGIIFEIGFSYCYIYSHKCFGITLEGKLLALNINGEDDVPILKVCLFLPGVWKIKILQ